MATETDSFLSYPSGAMASFNRYGLPGVVIGTQFVIITGLIYVVVTALQANTKAMTEFTGVLRDMRETMRERP